MEVEKVVAPPEPEDVKEVALLSCLLFFLLFCFHFFYFSAEKDSKTNHGRGKRAL